MKYEYFRGSIRMGSPVAFGTRSAIIPRDMSERRRTRRSASERRHPLREKVKLRLSAPALERRLEKRERLTVKLRAGIIERLRNAVFYTPGLTINGFIEQCINSIVDQMEEDRGSTFPERTENLRAGRPAKQPIVEPAARPRKA